ncbi:lipopolysaccharide assembly protein LapA domain-containing protein [Novosphingobium cyanobacteriorum]|uniref:DUF1049 domain-containing protein n=1 Tax=Novosphingobium cyanobacteriorum TaxID=3024215 RepID=A0ABT6CHM7_9SPHN|nr:lipopolysaccharide assembly protein LapA domain-containing protein [Novosphingobium cyanobacteriorum]MDF8333433.1 DUF1049 domain-containing protein [Novosphingobium cyanobacteriorum]
MRALRTIFWVLVAGVLAAFTVANWNPVEVRIWDGLVLDTKLPALVVGAFLLGLLPMWALYRTTRWRLQRRITNLEGNLQQQAAASLTSTQLDAASKNGTDRTP